MTGTVRGWRLVLNSRYIANTKRIIRREDESSVQAALGLAGGGWTAHDEAI